MGLLDICLDNFRQDKSETRASEDVFSHHPNLNSLFKSVLRYMRTPWAVREDVRV